MATKEKPGEFDCYANALPNEPMFVLLARDEVAPHIVRIWNAVRCGDTLYAMRCMNEAFEARGFDFRDLEDPKSVEAERCAEAMLDWKRGV